MRGYRLMLLALLMIGTVAEPSRRKSLRLYVFRLRHARHSGHIALRIQEEELAIEDVRAVLFGSASRAQLMWDSGPVPDSNFKPGGGPATMRYATSTKPLTARLAEIGAGLVDITHFRLSFSLGPRRHGNLRDRCAQSRTRDDVRRSAIAAHGACKFQRAQKQQNRIDQ